MSALPGMIDPLTGLPYGVINRAPTAGVMGMPAPQAKKPSIMDRIGGILGPAQNPGGLLSGDEQKAARQQAMMAMAAQLMQAGGPSTQPIGTGQAIGSALMTGQQAHQQGLEQALQAQLLKARMQQASAKKKEQQSPFGAISPEKFTPESMRKFTQSGDYGDLVPVVESKGHADKELFEWFQKLPPDQKQEFMSMKRQPITDRLAEINGVQNLVNPLTRQVTPLTTLDAEASAREKLKESESRGSAFGKAGGELAAGILKKGNDAKNVQSLLDGADALIDVATGSVGGAVRDKVAAVFGYAPDSAQAAAELQVLQAQLMLQQPRMEGPQGVLDVQLYQQMAGEIGNPTVPAERKKAAMRTIRKLQQKYVDNAIAVDPTSAPAQQPKRSREEILKSYGL